MTFLKCELRLKLSAAQSEMDHVTERGGWLDGGDSSGDGNGAVIGIVLEMMIVVVMIVMVRLQLRLDCR